MGNLKQHEISANAVSDASIDERGTAFQALSLPKHTHGQDAHAIFNGVLTQRW